MVKIPLLAGLNLNFFSSLHRLEMEGDGTPGSRVRLYNLPSLAAEHWEDTSDLAYDGTIPAGHTSDDPILLPFCVPRRGGKTKLVAVQVSQGI